MKSSEKLVERVLVQLAARRVQLGMTQEDLALRAGIDRSHVGLLEKNLRSPSLEVALRLAQALNLSLAEVLRENEARDGDPDVAMGSNAINTQNRQPRSDFIRNARALTDLTGLESVNLLSAIAKAHSTLDRIDAELARASSPPIASIVELANLSSMLGNVLGAAMAEHSRGLYVRNGPHKYPDLLPTRASSPGLEIKVALEKNRPKGHLPKPGNYLSVRYVLAKSNGDYQIGTRATTVWIWEVKVGNLRSNDFALSSTDGDSGKTAVVRTDSFNKMPVVYLDDRFIPHPPRKGKRYPGFN